MSLSALVNFGQRYSRRLSPNTNTAEIDNDLDAVRANVQSDKLPRRPRLLAWISQRTADQELPIDSDYPWRIEAPIGPQQPPPDVEALGADALAFYAPFHFYKKGWGIFVRASGVLYFAEVLKGESLRPGDESFLDLAEGALVEHEWHHAASEIACTRAELIARRALYIRYFDHSEAAELEEALANAEAAHWMRDADDSVRSRAERWMSAQGPGYRDYKRWTTTRAFSLGRDRAARFMTPDLPSRGPRADPSVHTFLFRGVYLYRSMPVSRIDDLGALGVSVLRRFPREHGIQVFVHSREHPPPHIHVRTLSGGEEARYSWPELAVLKNDQPLKASAEKGLRLYIKSYGTQIEAKIRAVYGPC